MGRTYDAIDERLGAWLLKQPVFFVATAPLAATGLVNCSPKSNRGELAVLDAQRVAYLDQTGSGVETIAHLRENGRILIMFCAFEGPPRIVRLHGTGSVTLRDDPDFEQLAQRFDTAASVGTRSIVTLAVARVADSCGYAVPVMRFESHRDTLDKWADKRGADGIRAYWAEKNSASLDGCAGIPIPAGVDPDQSWG